MELTLVADCCRLVLEPGAWADGGLLVLVLVLEHFDQLLNRTRLREEDTITPCLA